MNNCECPEWDGLECEKKDTLRCAEYYEALIRWVETHPSSSFNTYVKARDELRKKFGVEFLEKWR